MSVTLSNNIIVLDIETSGVDSDKNSILSIGAISWDGKEKFYGECAPFEGAEITDRALEINGFTKEYIVNQQSLQNLMTQYSNWTNQFGDKYILAGHQIGSFDMQFLNKSAARTGVKLFHSYKSLDLHSISYFLFGESLTLHEIALKLGIEPEKEPHNALNGAICERNCLVKIYDRISINTK